MGCGYLYRYCRDEDEGPPEFADSIAEAAGAELESPSKCDVCGEGRQVYAGPRLASGSAKVLFLVFPIKAAAGGSSGAAPAPAPAAVDVGREGWAGWAANGVAGTGTSRHREAEASRSCSGPERPVCLDGVEVWWAVDGGYS